MGSHLVAEQEDGTPAADTKDEASKLVVVGWGGIDPQQRSKLTSEVPRVACYVPDLDLDKGQGIRVKDSDL